MRCRLSKDWGHGAGRGWGVEGWKLSCHWRINNAWLSRESGRERESTYEANSINPIFIVAPVINWRKSVFIYWDHTLRSGYLCQDYLEQLQLRKTGEGEASKLAQSCKHFHHLLFGLRKIRCVHLFLAIFRIVFPCPSLYVCDDMGGTSWTCGCENKTLHHFFYHKEKHTDVHTEAICHLGVGGPRGVHCVSSGSQKRIQFLVLQKKRKKNVHICMDVYVG